MLKEEHKLRVLRRLLGSKRDASEEPGDNYTIESSILL
jgi:hypothetical protein